jgi:ADP-ribose pyrophosphatase
LRTTMEVLSVAIISASPRDAEQQHERDVLRYRSKYSLFHSRPIFFSPMNEADAWKTISSKSHFANRHLEVVTEEVCTPGHATAHTWTVVHRKPAVVIAPMTREGKVILIRQERIPIRAAIWEMPAGQIDDVQSDKATIEEVALRELREETGYQLAPDGEIISLGHYFSSPGFTDERAYFFLARPVESSAGGHAHHESESILDCRGFAPEEINRMIAANEIQDANTLSICARLVALGFLLLR